MVNDFEPNQQARIPNPEKMLKDFYQKQKAASTLKLKVSVVLKVALSPCIKVQRIY